VKAMSKPFVAFQTYRAPQPAARSQAETAKGRSNLPLFAGPKPAASQASGDVFFTKVNDGVAMHQNLQRRASSSAGGVSTFTSAAQMRAQWASVTSNPGAATSVEKEMGKFFGKVGTSVSQAGEKVGQVFKMVGERVGQVVEKIGNVVTSVGEKIGKAVEQLGKFLGGLFGF